MELSKHNIISKLEGSDDYFIVNLLSGNADIISAEEANAIKSGTSENIQELTKKGYLVEPAEEKKKYRQAYLDFIDQRDTDEIQIFYVPSYACNFNCTYCYQVEYEPTSSHYDTAVVDAFFKHITKTFAGRKKYITVFGGEPMLPAQIHKDYIAYIIKKATELNIEIALVTNGYLLSEYLDVLAKGKIREVQVTLDGIKNMHDKRRPLKNGNSTFDKIVEGIDGALGRNFPVNLRMVVDKENIGDLPKLAQFAIDKGWTKSSLFKTQLGRNYELHYCQHNQKKLYDRIEIYQDVYRLLKQYPHIVEFYKPAFSVSKFLFEEGELPVPLFDSCPGTKTEWAFDYTGSIYSCTATVGKPGEKLGSFYPEIELNEDEIEKWQERDVVSIKGCENCNLQLACGGGCGSVAKNNNKGDVLTPDCRPVKELLELGIAYYGS